MASGSAVAPARLLPWVCVLNGAYRTLTTVIGLDAEER